MNSFSWIRISSRSSKRASGSSPSSSSCLRSGPIIRLAGDDVHHLVRVGDRLQRRLGFLGQLGHLAHVVGELAGHGIHERLQARPLGRRLARHGAVAHREDRADGLRTSRRVTRSWPSTSALSVPSDRRESCTTLARVPDAVDVVRTRVVGDGRFLRGHDERAPGLMGLLQRAHALVSLHEDGSQHPREEDEVTRG